MSPAPPRIAVILPVYNGEPYLEEAIRSVLDQTYTDFQFVVIDDGSTDRSAQIVEGFSDPRIRLIRLAVNGGLVAALNTGIAQSTSELIARMDADDVCLPRRFERQVAFLDAHPNVMICGTWTQVFGDQTCVRRPPSPPRQVHAGLFFGFAMDHPSIMMRRAFLERHALRYRDEFRHVEDVDLFLRASALGDLANVPEILLHGRAHEAEVSVRYEQEQKRAEARLRIAWLERFMSGVTTADAAFHAEMVNEALPASSLRRAEQWLVRLGETNRMTGAYDSTAFACELRGLFYRLHVNASTLTVADVRAFWRSSLGGPPGIRAAHAAGLLAHTARQCLGRVGRPILQSVRRVGRRIPGRS